MKWIISWNSSIKNMMKIFWMLTSICFNIDWWSPLLQNFIQSLLRVFINMEEKCYSHKFYVTIKIIHCAQDDRYHHISWQQREICCLHRRKHAWAILSSSDDWIYNNIDHFRSVLSSFFFFLFHQHLYTISSASYWISPHDTEEYLKVLWKDGQKYDACIIHGPKLLPPSIRRNMNHSKALRDEEPNEPPIECKSQPLLPHFKYITSPQKNQSWGFSYHGET